MIAKKNLQPTITFILDNGYVELKQKTEGRFKVLFKH